MMDDRTRYIFDHYSHLMTPAPVIDVQSFGDRLPAVHPQPSVYPAEWITVDQREPSHIGG